MIGLMVFGVLAVIGLILLLCSFTVIRQQTVGIVECLGKFSRLLQPGFHIVIPIIEQVRAECSLRIRELCVEIETKTKDNVIVKIKSSVQLRIMADKVREAYYSLSDPDEQMESYIFDIIRAEVPKMLLDEVFENKTQLAQAVSEELKTTMDDYGFEIIKALVTDIDPDATVKDAMNQINEAQRQRVAANERGEADKILTIKAAEAESESKRLQGEGIAKQRLAIVKGLEESVSAFTSAVQGSSVDTVMNLIMVTQYFDTIREVGSHSNSNVLMIPHSPAGVQDIFGEITKANLMGNMARRAPMDAFDAPVLKE